MTTKVIVHNKGVPTNFEKLITLVSENVVDDVYTYSSIDVELVLSGKKVNYIKSNTIPIFARANTLDFFQGDAPRIIISTSILWYINTIEAITGTIAHEMAHLELAHEYGSDILTLPNVPFVRHISNIWSDCYVNHYLVKQGLSHVHLASTWELSSGNLSVFMLATLKRKPSTRKLRREYLIDLLVDLTEIVPLFMDKRTSQLANQTYQKITKFAVPFLGSNSVRRVKKLAQTARKNSVLDWVEKVDALVKKQK